MTESELSLTSKDARWILGFCSKIDYIKRLGFEPFPWQEAILNSKSRRIIINAARQSGKSTITSTDPCWIAKFKDKSLSIVLAPTESQSQDDMRKIQQFIRRDPEYPKYDPASTHVNVRENESLISVVPATQSARGKSQPAVVILDEASQIEDLIYTEVVTPMFTANDGRLILLSTPYGKKGFFFDIFNNPRPNDPWERYEVRSPWQPIQTPNGLDLIPYMDGDEKAYQEERAKKGIKAWFSPRHYDYEEQLEKLFDMGIRKYQQEYCCEFVETETSVFSYDEVSRMFTGKRPEVRKEPVKRSGVEYSILEA